MPYQGIRQLFQATVAARMDYGAMIWHRPQANGSTASTIQVRKFTTVQRLAMKAALGCYHTTPTAAMELESGIQPVWLCLQTKVLSATTRAVSLVHGHPVKKWLAKAKRKAAKARTVAVKAGAEKCKIVHMSNLENIAVQFPFVLEDIEEVKPFMEIPWDPGPQLQQQNCQEVKQRPTKQTRCVEIKKLAETTWQEQWNAAERSKNRAAPHLQKIIKDDLEQGRQIYKSMWE